MKKVIKLTESDLVRLVKRVINERRFANQSEVDRILDKISSEGMDSLTPEEKEILQNPDKVEEKEPEVEEPKYKSEDEENDFVKLFNLLKKNLDYILKKFPLQWSKAKFGPNSESIKERMNDLMEKTGQLLDILEDMDSESYEVEECKKLFSEALEMIDELFNEDIE